MWSAVPALWTWSEMNSFAEAGVAWVWLAELATEAPEVYELGEGGLRLHRRYSGGVRVRARPFERLTLDLGLLWAAVDADPRRAGHSARAPRCLGVAVAVDKPQWPGRLLGRAKAVRYLLGEPLMWRPPVGESNKRQIGFE